MKNILVIFILLLSVLTQSCYTRILFKPEARIDTIRICTRYSMQGPQDMNEAYGQILNDFIAQYNKSDTNIFKLQRTSTLEQSNLVLDFSPTKLVTKKDQTTGVIITSLGFITPIAFFLATGFPLPIFFYANPANQTAVQLTMHEDLTKVSTKKIKLISSGYFGDRERQIRRQGIKFGTALRKNFRRMEFNYFYRKGYYVPGSK